MLLNAGFISGIQMLTNVVMIQKRPFQTVWWYFYWECVYFLKNAIAAVEKT